MNDDDPQLSNAYRQTNAQRVLAWLARMSWLGVVAFIAWYGEKEGDGGFIKELWAQAKVASPFAAMLALYLFWDERTERRSAQQQLNERTIDYIQSNNKASSAFDKMANAVALRRRK